MVVYFVKPDLETPLESKPTDVGVTLELPGDEVVSVKLGPEPKANEIAGSARFGLAA